MPNHPNVALDAPLTAARRRRLADRLGGGAALFVSGSAPRRSHTIAYPFRPDSDFYYLTGLVEPEAALLLRGGEAIAFVRPRDPASEAWDGRRLGVEAAAEALGVDASYPIAELPGRLAELLEGQATLCYGLGQDPVWDARVAALVGEPRARLRATPATVVHPRALLHELRLFKGPEEVRALERAAAATAAGFLAAREAIGPGANERAVRAALEGAFLREGADGPAYNTIVAGGANATCLHYTANDQALRAGELVLVDAGAEVACYASDVTRTFAVDGAFTGAQREAYAVVLAAQAAAIAALHPGRPVHAYHEAADLILAEGLVALGVLAGDPAELVAAGRHKPYTLHGAGHFLGLDTHDVGQVRLDGRPRPLAPGMVLTVEPGLYFGADDPAVPLALRGLGIRIEDDVLVEAGGPRVLTAAIPK